MNSQTMLQQALVLHRRGMMADAQVIYEKILNTEPDNFDALHLLGVIANHTAHPQRAADLIGKAIEICPNNPVFYLNRGIALVSVLQLEAAAACFGKAVELDPSFAEAFYRRGNVLQELEQLDEAVACFDKVIDLRPDNADAFYNRGNARKALLQLEAAVASYDHAVALKPDYVAAYVNRGTALQELGQLSEAIASYDKAIGLSPNFAVVYFNRGNALQDLKQLEAAVASYDKAIELQPDYVGAYANRGNALLALHQWVAACSSYDKAIALNPGYPEAFNNRGNALKELWQLSAAIASYDQAIAKKPGYADAYLNRGIAFAELNMFNEAVASYEEAIKFKPDFFEAYGNRGNALLNLKRLTEAVASYKKALELKPDYLFLLGTLLHTRMLLCDWNNIDTSCDALITALGLNEKVSPPFTVISITDSPALQRLAAEVWSQFGWLPSSVLGSIRKRDRTEKIRIAYFSMDFRDHPVSYLTAELFETHDRDRFEVYAFSYGVDTKDEMRVRLEAAFDHFIDVRNKSDTDIAELSRQMQIDIAIDLAGLTGGARSGIFAFRAAPVQVNYLGYPGTMGAQFMDYLIADKHLIPEHSRAHYSEKIAYLPDTYMAQDSKRKISSKVFDREELGLAQAEFVFCCFNNSYKISPSTFDSWMRILRQVRGSVLWLSENNPNACANLRKEAQNRGVDPQRLVFARRMPLVADHLARHRAADLFLDTLPYNAHTTASDALWAGLPVLTCMGQSFASRVAASLLSAIGLPELITQTQAQYEALAVDLASKPERLKAIKLKLERNRLTTPLFDTKLFARYLEDAYTQMYERYFADLAPDHIDS